MSRIFDRGGRDASAGGAIWPYTIGLPKIGAAIWRPRILDLSRRIPLAPILRSSRGWQSANMAHRSGDEGNGNTTSDLQKPRRSPEPPPHSRGLTPSYIVNGCLGSTDRGCRLSSRAGYGTTAARHRAVSNVRVGQYQKLVMISRILSRHAWRDNTRTAARGMLSTRVGVSVLTWRDNRSVSPRPFPSPSGLLKLLPLRNDMFHDSGPSFSVAGGTVAANTRLPGREPGGRGIVGSIVPRRRSDLVTRDQSLVGDVVWEQANQPALLSRLGSDVRVGVSRHGWDESNDSNSRPNKNINGTLYVDSFALSQWLISCLGQEAGRACTSTTMVDFRTVLPWSVPNLAM